MVRQMSKSNDKDKDAKRVRRMSRSALDMSEGSGSESMENFTTSAGGRHNISDEIFKELDCDNMRHFDSVYTMYITMLNALFRLCKCI